MKKLNFFALAIIGIYACLNFSSCKKDDVQNNSLLGIWAENGDPSEWGILITKDCWIMDDYGQHCSAFVPYLNAQYEKLVSRFAPNDEFFIYRYNKEGDYYILYSGDRMEDNGEILFWTKDLVIATVNISGESLTCKYEYANSNFGENHVTREEIMTQDKYGVISSNIVIDKEYTDICKYTRFKY